MYSKVVHGYFSPCFELKEKLSNRRGVKSRQAHFRGFRALGEEVWGLCPTEVMLQR